MNENGAQATSEDVSGIPGNQERLSLGELHQAVTAGEDGLKLSYSAFADVIATGDIKEQLKVVTVGKRLEFSPDMVMILREFWPVYRELGGKKANAPDILRRFLASRSGIPGNQETGMVNWDSGIPGNQEMVTTLKEIRDLLQATTQAHPDRLLPRAEAAALLACHPHSVARYVQPVRKGVWRESDIYRYIAKLGEK